ncbi:hypothetical protein IQ22_02883 [Pseudomonas duriflava]|uniref:Uncharacterized protein n=1 Tax=Pseudomonas duriflava TaxID=459528 RepID=A0A562Q8M5_9PSED|nr:hypothetical protein [Pseudomonas duriflava]TWI53044.1 hypothetical protein IQ22_02883 [Pseudomonas duriflava]
METAMFKRLIGLFNTPSEEELKLAQTINNSYKSLRVVGRGTIRIDPEEIFESPEFKQDLARAKRLVSD